MRRTPEALDDPVMIEWMGDVAGRRVSDLACGRDAAPGGSPPRARGGARWTSPRTGSRSPDGASATSAAASRTSADDAADQGAVAELRGAGLNVSLV